MEDEETPESVIVENISKVASPSVAADLTHQLLYDSIFSKKQKPLIVDLWQENPGVVLCAGDCPHGLSDGAVVSFSEVQGMTELNSAGPMPIKYLSECLEWREASSARARS